MTVYDTECDAATFGSLQRAGGHVGGAGASALEAGSSSGAR